jgi:low density lipoprotein-related protein 2
MRFVLIKLVCFQLNECLSITTSNCSQLCTNSNGTYSCGCDAGFSAQPGFLGSCKAEKSPPSLYLSNGPEIRQLTDSRTVQIVTNEKRVESIDISRDLIYWADSYDRTIKRSWIPGKRAGANIGFGQDLEIKSNGKLTSVKVDFLTKNVYWAETDRSGSKPKGRVGVCTEDGRYRKTLISSGIEFPTSVALDPELGIMFWADAGGIPKVGVVGFVILHGNWF